MAPFPRTTALAHYRGDQTFGRPSLYKPEYCEMVIEAMAEGFSLTAFAGMIRVSRDAVYDWMRQHPDFSNAVSRADPARQLWWERKMMRAKKGAEASTSMFALKNIAPSDWRDVKHTEHQHTLRARRLTHHNVR
jgi:hypothetical protein